MEEAIFRSCEIKAGIIAQDEREQGIRSLLNFGHTIGHALEAASDYLRVRHGETVLAGMLAEAYVSWKSGRLNEPEFHRLERLLARIPLNASFAGIDKDRILGSIKFDKKASDGLVKMALPVTIGQCEVTRDFAAELIGQAIDYALARFGEWGRSN
jgi:3-dehydroquinate synthase